MTSHPSRRRLEYFQLGRARLPSARKCGANDTQGRVGRWLSYGYAQVRAAHDQLCRGARVPYLHQVEVFKDGEVLFDYCNRFGFEGRRVEAAPIGLRQRIEPLVGQREMPAMEAGKQRALAVFEKPDAR